MNKRLIIYISCAIVLVVILGVSIYFLLFNNSKNTAKDNVYETKKVTIEIFEDDNLSKTIEVKDKKKVEQLIAICDNVSLEQDDVTEYLAIRNDVKINLNNGIFFFVQLNQNDYCYIENSNSNIKSVIKMPTGLLELVNSIIDENK